MSQPCARWPSPSISFTELHEANGLQYDSDASSMMDPFSIITGTIGVIDVCWRFGKYLKDLQAGAAKVDDEVASLLREIEALASVTEIIQIKYKKLQDPPSYEESESKQIVNLWRNIASNQQDSRLILEDLRELVESIPGKESTKTSSKIARKLDGFRKQLKKQSKENEFYKLQSRLRHITMPCS